MSVLYFCRFCGCEVEYELPDDLDLEQDEYVGIETSCEVCDGINELEIIVLQQDDTYRK